MKASNRRVLDLLRLRGADGLTEAEATSAIACRRLAARVWDLRHVHGIAITDAPERTPMGAVIKRYYLAPEPTTFRPVTGTQLGVF